MLNRTGRSKQISNWIPGNIMTRTRTPMMYCRPETQSSWLPWKNGSLAQGSTFLENTNETFHPSLRYRHYCKNQDKLGAEDQGPYEIKSMDGWTWPAKQPDGRIGSEGSSASAGNFAYSRSRGKKIVRAKESSMGYYEKLLLAMYDQDSALQKQYGDVSIWDKVLGRNE